MLSRPDDFLTRPIKIHVCKDKTLSWRGKGQRVFNGRALAVFSVNSEQEAKDLFILVGRKQYKAHSEFKGQMRGQPWYKITLDGQLDFQPELELDDLDAVAQKLERAYNMMMARRAEAA